MCSLLENIFRKRVFYTCKISNAFLSVSCYRLLFITNTSAASIIPASSYMSKANNRNTRTRCQICSKLIIKTQERRQWCRSGTFIVNFEHISHLDLVFLLLALNMQLTARLFRWSFRMNYFPNNIFPVICLFSRPTVGLLGKVITTRGVFRTSSNI